MEESTVVAFVKISFCLKKNQNAPRPSEHPPVRGKKYLSRRGVCCSGTSARIASSKSQCCLLHFLEIFFPLDFPPGTRISPSCAALGISLNKNFCKRNAPPKFVIKPKLTRRFFPRGREGGREGGAFYIRHLRCLAFGQPYSRRINDRGQGQVACQIKINAVPYPQQANFSPAHFHRVCFAKRTHGARSSPCGREGLSFCHSRCRVYGCRRRPNLVSLHLRYDRYCRRWQRLPTIIVPAIAAAAAAPFRHPEALGVGERVRRCCGARRSHGHRLTTRWRRFVWCV